MYCDRPKTFETFRKVGRVLYECVSRIKHRGATEKLSRGVPKLVVMITLRFSIGVCFACFCLDVQPFRLHRQPNPPRPAPPRPQHSARCVARAPRNSASRRSRTPRPKKAGARIANCDHSGESVHAATRVSQRRTLKKSANALQS